MVYYAGVDIWLSRKVTLSSLEYEPRGQDRVAAATCLEGDSLPEDTAESERERQALATAYLAICCVSD